MNKIKDFNWFLSTIPNIDNREKIEKICENILIKFPELKLEIKWNQPMFIFKNTFILALSCSKNHFSIAPEDIMIERYKNKLEENKYSYSKKLFRILWNQEINMNLLYEMIEENILEKQNSIHFWR